MAPLTTFLPQLEEMSGRKLFVVDRKAGGLTDAQHIYIYRLVIISIERSKTAQKSTLEIRDKFSPRQNAVQDKIQSMNFFPNVRKKFFGLNFVSDCICLGLNFVMD